ncbi:MAG: phenylacetate--CoA ligase [Coriobacteriia bacterium]|nr:phenylacetate--CoA ligase [Coriobacteriia bacterium]
MPIWNPEIETMPRAKLEELQLKRLKSSVAWAYERVEYYRNRMDASGVSPQDIKTLNDVEKLPFTDKSALRDTYPFGMFALPLEDVTRLHSSSGTTGKPIVVGYSKADLNTWTDLCARVASQAGVVKSDRVDMAFLYGMFTGGWGMHYGMERTGATMIPAGSGNTERHLMMMKDFATTVLVSTPSYALYLAEQGEKLGYDFEKLPLRLGVFGGEPCTGKLRQQIEERLHIEATDNYGLSEVGGPGVSGECHAHVGQHIAEDQFLVEIVDPLTGKALPYGELGELVITTLNKEAFPIFRYRTHDLTRLHPEKCECGRTHVRMEQVRKRTDDMLIIRGVNVFPSQIEDVLYTIEGVQPRYQIIVDRVHNLDDISLKIEIDAALFSDKMADMVAMEKKIIANTKSVLGLRAKVILVEPGSLERTQGKSKHVLDLRDKD